jgi:hypothetical protein
MSVPLFKSKCCEYTGDDKTPRTLCEKSKTYVPLNPKRKQLQHYKVDGCLIKTESKCDYLMLNHTNSVAYFIELKGRALDYAAYQILCSIEVLKSPIEDWTIHARIVLSKVAKPELNGSHVVSLKRLLRRYGGWLDCGSKKLEEII